MRRRIKRLSEYLVEGIVMLVATIQILLSQQTQPGIRYLLYPAIEWPLIGYVGAVIIYQFYTRTTTESPSRPFPWKPFFQGTLLLEGYLAFLAGILFLNGTRW